MPRPDLELERVPAKLGAPWSAAACGHSPILPCFRRCHLGQSGSCSAFFKQGDGERGGKIVPAFRARQAPSSSQGLGDNVLQAIEPRASGRKA